MSASNCVLDSIYPAMEPVPSEYSNNIFGRRFGVLIFDKETSMSARYLTNTELLLCYSIPHNCTQSCVDIPVYTSKLDYLLPFCIPVNLRASVTSQLIDLTGFADDIHYSTSESAESYQCYQMSASPTSMDWTSAYNKDSNKKVIYTQTSITAKPIWSQELFKQIQEIEFHQHLKTDCIRM